LICAIHPRYSQISSAKANAAQVFIIMNIVYRPVSSSEPPAFASAFKHNEIDYGLRSTDSGGVELG